MKKYYLFLILISSFSYSQILQNANWRFGEGVGINFNTSPTTALTPLPVSLGYFSEEGSAQISDNNGNLIFFTDGQKVWRPDGLGGYNLIMSNLFGDPSSAQNAIILHKPGSPNHYYIFTINGATGNDIYRGLYYSEIVINENSSDIIFQNTPLKDDLGQLLNNSWSNISEALTSALHADNYQYWVVAHLGKTNGVSKVLSFLVTDLGVVNQIPSSSTNFFSDNFAFCLKIKNNKIGIGLGTDGGYLGNFNNTNGNVDFTNAPKFSNAPQGCYSLEFSPNGQNLFFTSFDDLKIRAININNPLQSVVFNNTYSVLKLQLGIDNKIYVVNSMQSLGVLHNPDNINFPQYQHNYIQLTFGGPYIQLGLPQLVPIQLWDGPCINTMDEKDDVFVTINTNQQASNLLTTSATIVSGVNAKYHAGVAVVLSDGFHAQNGAIFRAYIEGCSGVYVGRGVPEKSIYIPYSDKNDNNPQKQKYFNQTRLVSEFKQDVTNQNPAISFDEQIKIYPNPVKGGVLYIDTQAKADKNVAVFDVLGKQVINVSTASNAVNVSGLTDGVYIVKITENGNTATRKLVINN